MTFIERLEQLRQEKGITRKKLLEDCKLGKNQFTLLGENNAIPTPSVLFVLARYLKVTPEYLLGESDDKDKETSDIEALPDLEQTLLFCFENCDAMGQMRIIQLAMNEHDRTQKEKTGSTGESVIG
mgnify:FL=1